MDLRRRQFLFLTAGAAAVPFISRTAKAQAYPARPVRVIVPFSPGGQPIFLHGSSQEIFRAVSVSSSTSRTNRAPVEILAWEQERERPPMATP